MYGELNSSGPRIGWLLCVDAPTATNRACAIVQIYTHFFGARHRIRTGTPLAEAADFKSAVSTFSPPGQIILVRRERLELSILSALAS